MSSLGARLQEFVGKPVGSETPAVAPDPVNVPMIRHWVAAFEDHNPVYLDAERAAASRFGQLVAPPLMLQTWTMATPKITGIAEHGGSPVESAGGGALAVLDDAGFVATLAANSEFEIERYLRVRRGRDRGDGDRVDLRREADAPRPRVLRHVGHHLPGGRRRGRRPPALPHPDVIATRDFTPVHHDRDYANAQGAPDIFMNILSSTAYCSRFLTDWAGPEAMIRRLAIRLGVPVHPGTTLAFTGAVTGTARDTHEGVVDVELRAATGAGDHLTGTATMTLPLG